jgi:hypothetical protein
MPSFRGRDVQVTFDGTDISGDGRSVSFNESAEVLDDSKYGQDARTKVAGLTDGSGSMNGLDTSGDWSAAWQAIKPASTGTMIIYPEGNAAGKRTLTFTAVVNERSVEYPYDNLATFSMSFEVSGDITEGTVGA